MESYSRSSLSTENPNDPPRLAVVEEAGISRVQFPRQKIDGVAVRMLYETAAALTQGKNPKMLVDLTGVASISSGVMGILVTIQKLFRHVGGQLHIASDNAMVLQQFEVMNLHLVLKLFPGRDTAVAQFKD